MREPLEGSSWILSETMRRGFSVCVGVGKIARGLGVGGGRCAGIRDLVGAGIGGLEMEGLG